jgi:hypothetical protein
VTGSQIDGDANVLMPFQIFSGSVKTGYVGKLTDAFRAGVEINGLHNDGYGPESEIPIQGPFTDTWVGGKQYRHYRNIGGDQAARPEGFRIYPGSNMLVVAGPDSTGSALFSSTPPRASYYREEYAKRPINIKNIGGSGGNYNNIYEVIMTSGRWYNNKDFVMSGGFSFSSSASPYIYGIQDYAKPVRGKYYNVIVERFSCPGEPVTMGDANGGPGLDTVAAEYSVYNSVNFRNSLVRNPLNTLSIRPCGQFGTDSLYGTVNVASYETSASFHKINKNQLERLEYSNQYEGVSSSYTYDNLFIQHPIPQDDAGFAWVMASTAASGTIGYN